MAIERFKQWLSGVGIAGLGLAMTAGGAIAQTLPENFADFLPPETGLFGLISDLQDLERVAGTFLCVNNPGPDCRDIVAEASQVDTPLPNPRYGITDEWRDRGGFPCLNSVNPLCENPLHYGIEYGPAPEIPDPDLRSRTASLWAQFDAAMSRPVTVPSRPMPAPSFTPAPIPGLW